MNQLINFQAANEMTMSSREIAELVEKRQDNVKRTIETLTNKGIITFTQIEEKSLGGRPAVTYHVNKRDSYVVVSQLSLEFTARLVDRWQELELNAVPNWLKNLSPQVKVILENLDRECTQAKAYIGRATKYIDHLEHQLASGVTPTAFAKQLNGVNSNQVQSFLKTKSWMTQERGSWMALHYARDKYLSVTFKEDPSGVHRPTCYLTELGAKALYRMYCKGELPMKKHWDGKLTPKYCLPILDKETEAANGPLKGPLKAVQMVG